MTAGAEGPDGKKHIADASTKIVKCPTCHKSIRYDYTNRFRPFCSKACRNQDIISWVEEGYKIPGEPIKKSDSKDIVADQDDDDGGDS